MTNFNRVTIIGCGLIGASFALALRRANVGVQIAGWDSSASELAEALRSGVIDEVDQAFARAGAGADVSSSDLLYLAMPVGEIVKFLRERGTQFNPDAVITDAGSTKVEICRVARLHLPQAQQFVGGHPVAGSHLQGLAHARGDLFAGAPYVLITNGEDEAPAHNAVRELLELLCARVTSMTAVEHDRVMALVSDLPQIASSALAAVTQDQPDADALLNLSGSGYRDMTRLAASSWAMWRDILATNPAETVTALDALIQKLTAVRNELHSCAEGLNGDLTVTETLFRDSGQKAQ